METKTFIEGVAVGAVAGAIAALLLAPKSGKETREDIVAHLEDIKDTLVQRLQDAGEFTQAKYDEVVQAVVAEYETAKKITADEAKEIQAKLRAGYESIKETACQHVCGEAEPASE